MQRHAETWINVTEADITKLTMPDTMLQRQLLSVSGNPSKVFMCLEVGVIPVRKQDKNTENILLINMTLAIFKSLLAPGLQAIDEQC